MLNREMYGGAPVKRKLYCLKLFVTLWDKIMFIIIQKKMQIVIQQDIMYQSRQTVM